MSRPTEASLAGVLGLHRAGRTAEAETACREFLRMHPGHADALNMLGTMAAQAGRLEEAVQRFRQAAGAAPLNAVILTNLAEALRLQGRNKQALPLLRQAVACTPGYPAAHFSLATALVEIRRDEEALSTLRQGLAHRPGQPDLNALAADLLLAQRRASEAAPHVIAALEVAPGSDEHWQRLERLLGMGMLGPAGRPWLLKALAHPVVRPRHIAYAIASTLCEDPNIASVIELVRGGATPPEALVERLEALGSDDLLIELMATLPIPSEVLERTFTGLRRAVVTGAELHDLPPGALRFCATLAVQSFHTDYAWWLSDGEDALADRLAGELGQALEDGDTSRDLPFLLTVVASYRPLFRLACVQAIAGRSWPAELDRLLRVQLHEPMEEQALRERIPRLTPISDELSRQVRAQYEENPYPRWTRAWRNLNSVTLPRLIAALGGTVPADPSFAAPDVLIAGCGTGQQVAAAANFYERSSILAVDLSLASLGHAWRKARELGLANVEFMQADLLEIGSVDRRFHAIECTGVLVCVDRPIETWRLLVDRLHPGGIMTIGLYSRIARRAFTQAQQALAARGYQRTAADIRRARREILDLPGDHPLASSKAMSDFYNLSECRDFLFHVKEICFTLPEIRDALDRLGLRFLGFSHDAPLDEYRRRFPDDPSMTSLDNWHRFEQAFPGTFVGMYQFWVQKPPAAGPDPLSHVTVAA